MRVNIIAAVAMNEVIGRDGALPWHLPDDLDWFRQCTMDCPVVMGRRTWESIGRPLPGRVVIVLTRGLMHSRFAGVVAAPSLDVALALAPMTFARPPPAVWIAGGADVYRQALPLADGVYLTRVHALPKGDTLFPPWKPTQWQLVAENRESTFQLSAGPGGNYGFDHFVFHRRTASPFAQSNPA